MEQSDYMEYRGKCKEYVDKAIQADPSLKAVRGYYHCPIWGKQEHWWCKRLDGSIYDPTVKQFPTAGICAEYEEYEGICTCEECGKRFAEGDGQMAGRHPVCSTKCALRLVGLGGSIVDDSGRFIIAKVKLGGGNGTETEGSGDHAGT